MISETPTLSSRTRHTSTKKRSSCCVGAFVMYIPSGADGSANTKQGCNRSCGTSTETSGKAGDAAVSPPNLLATVNQFGRANLGSLPNCRLLPANILNHTPKTCRPEGLFSSSWIWFQEEGAPLPAQILAGQRRWGRAPMSY